MSLIFNRDVEELALEHGLKVDHSTINRWVIRYSPQLEMAFRKKYKRPVGDSLLWFNKSGHKS